MTGGPPADSPRAAIEAAALGFDLDGLARLADAPAGRRAAWRAAVTGRWSEAEEAAAALEAAARRESRAAAVVEAAALRAFSAAGAGALEEATALARRASRMGRTEAIFEPECLAHLVLARVRRLTGHPHLATRILRPLWARTPPRFTAWLRWELAMAGARAREPEPSAPGGPLARAAGALGAALEAAEAADPRRYREATTALEAAATRLAPFAEEARALLDAVDPRRGPGADEVEAWRRGRRHEAPAALHGLLTLDGAAPQDESAIAYVWAAPSTPARRLTRLGWGLLPREGLRALPQSRRKQGRKRVAATMSASPHASGRPRRWAARLPGALPSPLSPGPAAR